MKLVRHALWSTFGAVLAPAVGAQGAPTGHELEGGVALEWEARWDGTTSAEEEGAAIAVHGNVAYTVSRSVGVAERWVETRATSSTSGALLWSSLREVELDFGIPVGVLVSPDGGAVYTAYRETTATSESVLVRYAAATGDEVWSVRLDSGLFPALSSIAVFSAELSSDGSRVVVTGPAEDQSGSGGSAMFTACFEAATGALLWSDLLDPAIAAGNSSWVVLTGGSPELVYTLGVDFFGNALVTVAYSLATGQVVWSDVHPGASSLADGALLASGVLFAYGYGAAVAYDAATGTELWTDPGAIFGLGSSAAAAPDGSRVFVTTKRTDGDFAVETRALDAGTGAEAWDQTFTPAGFSDQPFDLTVSPDGSFVVVTGLRDDPLQSADFGTFAYDAATGAELWSSSYDGTAANASDLPAAVAVTPDGSRVVVTGTSEGQGTGGDATAIAYLAADGAQLWEAHADQPSSATDQPNLVVLSPDGSRAFVAGASWGTVSQGELVAFDAGTGDLLWNATHPSLASLLGGAFALDVDPLATRAYVMLFQEDGYLVAGHDAADGSELWSAFLPGFESPVASMDLEAGSSGGAVFATFPRSGAWGVVALDGAGGATLWDASVPGQLPWALEPSPDDSRIFVTGRGFVGQIVTVALDAATGQELWSAFASPEGNPTDGALAVAPDGAAVFTATVLTPQPGPLQAQLAAHAADTGDVLWSRSAGAAVPALAVSPDGGRVFAVEAPFRLEVLDAQDGTTLLSVEHSVLPELDDVASVRLDPEGAVLLVAGTESGAASGRVAALDADTGDVLWRAAFDLSPSNTTRDAVLSGDGERFLVAAEIVQDGSSSDLALLAYAVPELTGNPATISLGAGGTQALELRAGAAVGGTIHLILGSSAGTSPGIPVGGGEVLPLNPSAYFDYTLFFAGAPPLSNALGLFDPLGRASASLTLASDDPTLVGVQLHHAFLALDFAGPALELELASNAVVVTLVP